MRFRLLAKLRDRISSGSGDGADSNGDDPDADGGTVWDVIPSWQYTGLHVESGGFTRDEQERALGDVRRQADEIEAVDDDRR